MDRGIWKAAVHWSQKVGQDFVTKQQYYILVIIMFFYNYVIVTISEEIMAPHSSTHAWKIPWMEEPGGLQSMGSLGVGHD